VLIKIGLKDIPALTFAGLRYTLAFACLLPFLLRNKYRQQVKGLGLKDFILFALLGLLYYTVTQGSQFLGLTYLPAASISLLLNFTTIIVVILGIFLLKELPSRLQWLGIVINLAGVLVYFYPVRMASGELFGLIVVIGGVFTNAASSILGRKVNRDAAAHPIVITTISMGTGGILLLAVGLAVQPLPHLSPINGLIVAWLAVVNTAFAFTLWNITLQTLSAMESSLVNSTMLVQIALLAWVFLGEGLGAKEITGLVLAGLGVVIVQLRMSRRPSKARRPTAQPQLPPTA
jgi:drug/metabolite transporter (DMT)-like permease